jgi:hypothetical protein
VVRRIHREVSATMVQTPHLVDGIV